MRQLLLDWGAAGPPTLDSFVIGRNQELAAILRHIARRETTTLDQRFITLWGEAGAGKSHLLYALAAGGRSLYLSADQPAENYVWLPEILLYLLDDCDCLDDDQ